MTEELSPPEKRLHRQRALDYFVSVIIDFGDEAWTNSGAEAQRMRCVEQDEFINAINYTHLIVQSRSGAANRLALKNGLRAKLLSAIREFNSIYGRSGRDPKRIPL